MRVASTNATGAKRAHTPAQVAEILQVSDEQVRRLIHSGRLEAFDASSVGTQRSAWRVPDEALQRFMTATNTAAPAPTTRRKRQTDAKTFV